MSVAPGPCLLGGDSDAFFERRGIVSANLGADAILQGRHDLAARRVVFGIRSEDEGNIKQQPDRVAFYLNVTFLHDVEERDLDLAGEVRQLIHCEDAAIGARQQTVVHRQFAAQLVATARRLDRIDIADQVRDRHVRRRELFDIAFRRRKPCNARRVTLLLQQITAAPAKRRIGIVVDFASGNVRKLWIEQGGQGAKDAALGLSTQTKQYKIMPGQNCIDDLRHYRVVIAHNARKNHFSGAQTRDEIVAQLVLHSAGAKPFF